MTEKNLSHLSLRYCISVLKSCSHTLQKSEFIYYLFVWYCSFNFYLRHLQRILMYIEFRINEMSAWNEKKYLIADGDLRRAAAARRLHPFLNRGERSPLYISWKHKTRGTPRVFHDVYITSLTESTADQFPPEERVLDPPLAPYTKQRGVMVLFSSSIVIVFIGVTVYAAAGPVQVKHNLQSQS